MTAHVFSWPPARLRHVRVGVGSSRALINSHSGRLAAWPNQRSLLYTSSFGILLRQRMVYNLCALRVECGRCCHCQRPPTSFRRLLVQVVYRNSRTKLSALLPGRPCSLYATIFHAAAKDRIAGEIIPASDLLSALAVYDKHRAEVLEFFNILQGLNIKQHVRRASWSGNWNSDQILDWVI